MSALATDFSLLDSPDVSRVVVGVSGGVDSMVLLDAVTRATDLPVVGLHINHHLHTEADRIAEFCLSQATRYSIPVKVIDVNVAASGSLETRARETRYAAFEAFLTAGDLLLLAHHADDQVETALFRLFRGSRVVGLEGMPFERPIGDARLCRPLLSATRQNVLSYAQDRQLDWLEDPTNADVAPDRNFIRHELLPVIDGRFPNARQAILSAISLDDRARARLQALSSAQVGGSQTKPNRKQNTKPNRLKLSLFDDQSLDQICDSLTWWFLDLNVPQPTGGFLENVANKIIEGRVIDEYFGDYSMNSFQGRLVVSRKLPEKLPENAPLSEFMTVPGGSVTNKKTKGQGLRADASYDIRYRSGGEKLALRSNRTLKNLFQENSVPPWLRARVPLIYSGEQLVAVAGLPDWEVPMLVADGWQAQAEDPGLEISLRLDEKIG